MGEKRLGDVIDDHCIKCRRVTNHSIVSLVEGEAAKVRCRTCYHDHDYRHEQAPPTKKELKKMEADALAAAEAAASGDPPLDEEVVVPADAASPDSDVKSAAQVSGSTRSSLKTERI
jgi:hypothetical protein